MQYHGGLENIFPRCWSQGCNQWYAANRYVKIGMRTEAIHEQKTKMRYCFKTIFYKNAAKLNLIINSSQK